MAQDSLETIRRQVAKLAQAVAARPIRTKYGGASSGALPLYFITSGTALPSGQTIGLVRRSDAVAGSEMPAGVGGSAGDVLVQSANPIPAGLPDGVCVGQNISDLSYAFLLCDSNTSYASNLPLGRRCFVGTVINLDKVVSSVTYRYPCYLVIAGY